MIAAAPPLAQGADGSCQRALTFTELAFTVGSLHSAVYGDFNEDGRTDIALHTFGGDTRTIALNRGSVFEPLPTEMIRFDGPDPVAVTAADVNRDGHLDLLYRTIDSITVALGRGDGTFQPPLPVQRFSPGAYDGSLNVLLDLNHDGIPDFVDFDIFNIPTAGFVRSKGDGTYEQFATVTLSFTAMAKRGVAADFDGDGNVDVVRFADKLGFTELTFGWNDGTYHFTETRTQIQHLPLTLQPLDIDGDGATELAGIDDGKLVVVRAKNRTVTAESIDVALPGTSIVLNDAMMTDVDGDGIRDLVSSGPPFVVLFGTADRRFRDITFVDSLGALHFTPVDLDGDGLLDFAETHYSANNHHGLVVLYGAALRARQPSVNRIIPTGVGAGTAALMDVDGDGIVDLVSSTATRASVLFGDGHGEFRRPGKAFAFDTAVFWTRRFAGDFDGDGHGDVAMSGTPADSKPGPPTIAFGASDGFGPTLTVDAGTLIGTVVPDPSSPPALVALKGDDVELVTISAGRQATVSTIYHRPADANVVVVRSAANGTPRIAVIATSGVTFLVRGVDGWHDDDIRVAPATPPTMVAAADFDGDGRVDVVAANDTTLQLYTAASGYTRKILRTWGSIDSVTPVDIDRDGLVDLLVTSFHNAGEPSTVQIFRNSGAGLDPTPTAMTSGGGDPFVGDADGDGWPDVLLPSTSGVEVLKNICARPRVYVEALPTNPVEGSAVKLVIRAISTDSFAIGSIKIFEGTRVLATQNASAFAMLQWTSPPLSQGAHTFRIEYSDQFGGTSETSIGVTAHSAVRRRAARP
jgi:FG-GAP-like repeat